MEWGLVTDQSSGEVLTWRGGAMVRGHAPELASFLRDKERRRERILEAARFSFAVDHDALEARLRSEGIATQARQP